MKAAKHKAEYLLSAIGEKPGKPLIVRENIAIDPRTNVGFYANSIVEHRSYKYEDKDRVQVDNFTKITFKASYYIKFSIE